MSCRLVVILPTATARSEMFRRWRSERTSGPTVTMSCDFEDSGLAMAAGSLLPYVWAIEGEERRT